ncbi:putative Serine-threonine-protein, partial [Naja naja]
ANVYHASTAKGENRAIKIYKTSILMFKDRDKYVSGEFRFRHGYCKGNPRKMVRTWAEKEMRNLTRCELTFFHFHLDFHFCTGLGNDFNLLEVTYSTNPMSRTHYAKKSCSCDGLYWQKMIYKLCFADSVINKVTEKSRQREADMYRVKDKSDRATVEQVLDPRTRMILFKMLSRGVISEINGCVSTGKEVG